MLSRHLHKHGRRIRNDLHPSVITSNRQQLPARPAPVFGVITHAGGIWDEHQANTKKAAQQSSDTVVGMYISYADSFPPLSSFFLKRKYKREGSKG